MTVRYMKENYFNRLKVNRACQLLGTTGLKINQICTMVGIDDSYYFRGCLPRLLASRLRNIGKQLQRKILIPQVNRLCVRLLPPPSLFLTSPFLDPCSTLKVDPFPKLQEAICSHFPRRQGMLYSFVHSMNGKWTSFPVLNVTLKNNLFKPNELSLS